MYIPLTFLHSLIFSASNSNAIMNKYPDNGLPWRTDLVTLKYGVVVPSLIMQLDILQSSNLTHRTKLSPKLNL